MQMLDQIGMYLGENVEIVRLGGVALAFLAFLFVAVDIFNLRKEAIETNLRLAEMNQRMMSMNKGLQQMVRYLIVIAEDIKTARKSKGMPVEAATAEPPGFDDFLADGM